MQTGAGTERSCYAKGFRITAPFLLQKVHLSRIDLPVGEDGGVHVGEDADAAGEHSFPNIIEFNSTLHIVYTWNRKKIKYVKVEVL